MLQALEYKTHRENARPHLVLTHYVELAGEKDVVLMVGELGDRNILTLQEAQNLVYQMQVRVSNSVMGFYCA